MKAYRALLTGLCAGTLSVTLSVQCLAANEVPIEPNAVQIQMSDELDQQLRLFGLQGKPSSMLQGWKDVMLELEVPGVAENTPVQDEALVKWLAEPWLLTQHITSVQESLLAKHRQHSLSEETKMVLQRLTSIMLLERNLAEPGSEATGVLFTRRLDTLHDEHAYKNVTLYRSLRNLIAVWQRTPEVSSSLFARGTPAVQEVREELLSGNLDEAGIALYSLAKVNAEMVLARQHNQNAAY
ncbi:hypothetical protein [Bowmanella yangjiangensis]|uniref:Uncharacterized protein n=1 Tax=Bowmanella yangjiangensis TaxID=2811230 RepID=A0ABS3CQ63_9ALTE|nr:hypothetical protein [Bowmanella yangjiangensis]MBN7819238.1 hypothetical protein [Bowmanella yangjiangensis]